MDKIALGNFLANLRIEKKLTQEQLAEILNVSSKTISKWECGTSSPDLDILNKLCELYNVSLYELTTLYKRNKNPFISKNNFKNIINKDSINRIMIMKISILVILFILLSFFTITTIYTINNYNKFAIYEVSSDNEDFIIDGILIKERDNYRLVISKMAMNDDNNSMLSNEYKLIHYNINYYNYEPNKKEIVFDETTSAYDAIKKININESINSKLIDIYDLHLYIEYLDNKSNYINYDIKLNIENKYSNNKLFY